jgi:signal transduction histidine kinase
LPVVVVPIAAGYLYSLGREAELFDRGLGASFFAVSMIVVLFIVLGRTAAAIRASDRRRRQAYEAAERANRLKDQFIAMLSHELRTPLNVMLGRLQLLEQDVEPETRIRHAAVIARNGQLLARLVEDLLDLSRAAAGQIELSRAPIELNVLVRTALEAVAGEAAKKGVTVKVELSENAGRVRADAQRMYQVLSNLLSNAVKFTPTGGSITIRTARIGQRSTVSVSDSGIGFDRGFEPHLFEPFRQADQSSRREYGGLGLGLAIARNLVELHGGTITGRSDGVGRGATFTVELPDVQPAVVSAALDQRERTRVPAS